MAISSRMFSASYDAENEILSLTFSNGAKYRYYNIPVSLIQEMEIAESAGTFFRHNIRDKFTTEKVVN